MRLTIAIPTYNRPRSLLNTIQQLIPQWTPDCQLLIVDNESSPPVADVAGPVLEQSGIGPVRIIRNPTNIGANANVLRCMELCDTEWLWILSDDDRIEDNTIQQILIGIDANPSCVCLNFAQKTPPRNSDSVTCGRTEFLSVLDRHLATLHFISTSVYRIKAMLPSITFGYMQIASLAPHLAVLVMALGTQGRVYFFATTIVEYMPAPEGSGWSQFWIERGFPLLLDLPLSAMDRNLLRRALRSRMLFSGILAAYVDTLCYGLRSRDMAVSVQLFRMFALRRATVTGSAFEWLVIRSLLLTLLWPGLALQAMRVVFRAARGQSMEERAACVGLSLDERV